jgi:hypothetical protein
MPHIRIYRHPACPKCARYAALHLRLDWFHHLEVSTSAPPCGPLRMGEVVVEDLATRAILHGCDAFAAICRQIPLYAPFRLLLLLPAFRSFVDRDMRGCGSQSCELRRPSSR